MRGVKKLNTDVYKKEINFVERYVIDLSSAIGFGGFYLVIHYIFAVRVRSPRLLSGRTLPASQSVMSPRSA